MICFFSCILLNTGQTVDLISPLEVRLAELLHHMKIETAVAEGAKNVVKHLVDRKIHDRRILSEVCVCVYILHVFIFYFEEFVFCVFTLGSGSNA